MSAPSIWQQHVSLQPYNTLSLAVCARYFIEVQSLDALREALLAANEQQLPVLLLGGGSNVVLVDDFAGLCIKLSLEGVELLREDDEQVIVKAMAGENWHQFVTTCLQRGWHGLENLALIPGTVGAAPVQNIGAYGVELADFMASLEVMDRQDGRVRTFNCDDCKFGYRDSIFKGLAKDRYVICAVTFQLRKQPRLNLSYGVLQHALSHLSEPTPKHLFDAVVAIRQSKIPDPATLANAGSFFKNPWVSSEQYQTLLAQYPDLVAFVDGDGYKLAAGWLIDQAGWKGFRKGDAGVHKDQALVLVNHEQCKGSELLTLAREIQQDIASRFGVELEVEPRIY